MTRKEQIKAILDDTLEVVVEEADINGKHYIGRKIILGKSEASEKIAALPLDVPGDDEIDAIVYAACKDAYDPDGCVTEAYKLGIKIAINEILKLNTP